MRTFVVRVWTPTEPFVEEGDPLRGVVEHVGSGRSTPFGSESELLALLRQSDPATPEATLGPAAPTHTTGG